MSELDEAWAAALSQAEQRARLAGRKDVLEYLSLKNSNDLLRKAGVDWQLVAYGGAVHAFTNPAAGNDNSKGAAYNEKADKRSWEAMKQFFGEIFGP